MEGYEIDESRDKDYGPVLLWHGGALLQSKHDPTPGGIARATQYNIPPRSVVLVMSEEAFGHFLHGIFDRLHR